LAPAPQIKIKINIKASEAAKNSSVKRVPQKKKTRTPDRQMFFNDRWRQAIYSSNKNK